MGQVRGQVIINDIPTKHKVLRFVEKKITQWVTDHEGYLPSDTHFSVSFFAEGDLKQVSCMTEIKVGECVWKGWDLSTDTQSAFMHSLKRLQPN